MRTTVLTLSFLILIYSNHSSAVACEPYQIPKVFSDTKLKVDEKIKTFANKKFIAQRADDTLLIPSEP